MEDSTPSHAVSQRPVAIADGSMKPAGWRLVNLHRSTTQRPSDPVKLNRQPNSTPGWSAVHDFERRLSRNGIKISEAINNATRPTVHVRGGGLARSSNHHATRSEDFPPLEAPTIASFTNTKETRVETLERLLRQTQIEARIWKEKAEMQELDLRASYRETMDWRMKYEDLYSTIIRGQDPEAEGPRAKRGGTKSWG